MSSRWQFGHLGLPSSSYCISAFSIHACKKLGLDADFKEDEVVLKSAMLDLEIAKSEYSSKKKEANKHKRKPTLSSEATSFLVVTKTTYKKALKAIEAAKLSVTTDRSKCL